MTCASLIRLYELYYVPITFISSSPRHHIYQISSILNLNRPFEIDNQHLLAKNLLWSDPIEESKLHHFTPGPLSRYDEYPEHPDRFYFTRNSARGAGCWYGFVN